MPVHVAVERLLPVVDHLHRTTRAQREHAGVDLHRQVLARPERAADSGQRQPYLLRGQAQARRELVAVDVEPLGGDVEVDAAVLGRHRQPRLRAEESLVLHADLVLAADHDVGRRPVRVTLADRLVPDDVSAPGR
jgi:hypothetical protein